MKLGRGKDGLVAFDPARDAWVAFGGDFGLDPITVLGDPDLLARARARLPDAPAAAPPAGLPFEPRSLRAFSIWEAHMVASSRALLRRFFPRPASLVVGAFEGATRQTFPRLKPPPLFYEQPLYYVGNHTAFIADGDEVAWPRATRFLDFELELGVVLASTVRDATPEEGSAAIGGFVVVNDWSARDVQADEFRRGVFGPVVKSKGFANSMGPVVVSADEALPGWDRLRGRVRVNGETWCEGSTEGAQHDLGAMVAYASRDETLAPGDLLCTGTLPGCCGLELDRWIQPGDRVELEIDGVGSVANRVGS